MLWNSFLERNTFYKTIIPLSWKRDVTILRGFLYSFARVNFAKKLCYQNTLQLIISHAEKLLVCYIHAGFKQLILFRDYNISSNLFTKALSYCFKCLLLVFSLKQCYTNQIIHIYSLKRPIKTTFNVFVISYILHKKYKRLFDMWSI